MKTHSYCHRFLVAALLGLALPAGAQSLASAGCGSSDSVDDEIAVRLQGTLPGTRVQPVRYASATVAEPARVTDQVSKSAVFDGVLKMPVSFTDVARHTGAQGMGAVAEELRVGVAVLASAYQNKGAASAPVDPDTVAVVVQRRVAAEPDKVLEIVESEVSARPNCACEVVKAAIKGSEADPAQVAQIVETACIAAPDMMRIISQCAIAAVPDALGAVQTVLAKLDPSAGDSSGGSKDAKDAKDAKQSLAKTPIPPVLPPPAASPLDLPRYTVPITPVFYPPPSLPPAASPVTAGTGGASTTP